MVAIFGDLARMMHDEGQISTGLQTVKGQQEMARFSVSKSRIGKRCQERANDKTHKYKFNSSCRTRIF